MKPVNLAEKKEVKNESVVTMGDDTDKDTSDRALVGHLSWPMLTRANYQGWAAHIKCNLEGLNLWEAIEKGEKSERRKDRLALGAMLRGVPLEMHSLLLNKETAKEAWEAIKTMRLGADRVKEVNAQKLLAEFESIAFKSEETIEDFAIRITKLVTDLRGLGEKSITNERIVRKFLRVVPPKYGQVAVSIEMFKNLKELTIEDLIGHLRAAEERMEPSVEQVTEKAGKLLLTEEEWAARNKSRIVSGSATSKKGGGEDGQQHKKEKHWKPRGKDAGGESRDNGLTSMGTPRRKGVCRRCGIYGHFGFECKKKQKKQERQEVAHHANADGESGALLVARVCNLVRSTEQTGQGVYLNQTRVFPSEYEVGSWVLDTGATNHMTGCRDSLASLDETVKGAVRFGDGSRVEIRGVGAVTIAGRNQVHRVLTKVYYIPSLRCNIVSLGQLEEAGCRVEIDRGVLTVFERVDGVLNVLIKAERKDRLYTLKLNLTVPVCLLSRMDEVSWLWHARYGHLNFRSLRDLGVKKMVDGLPMIQQGEQVCDGCALGKHHRTPFPRVSAYRAEEKLGLVHGDLCGPITPGTPGGKQYFLLLVDDKSRFMWIDLLKSKDQAFESFKKLQKAAESESGRQLKAFRTDRGGEFNSGVFTVYCNEHGIRRNTTAPFSPQQNGVVERRNQSVVEMARCLLKSMKVPGRFWGEAVTTAVYLLNRAPTKSLDGMTPFEAWFGKKPGVRHLRTFGCVCYAKRVGPGITKLSDRSVPGIFIGYEPGTKAYRVYDPENKRLMISRDVIFDEKRSWSWGVKGTVTADSEPEEPTFTYPDDDESEDGTVADPTIEEAVSDSENSGSGNAELQLGSPVPTTPSQSTIQWATPPSGGTADSEGVPQRYRLVSDLLDSTEPVQLEYSGLCLVAAEEPSTVDEALKAACWRRAMLEEMQAIEANRTWEVCVLPKNQKAIGLKWVFKVKKDPDGNIVKHKARLVAKGYAQIQGVDFEEVFAPVARIETVRVLLALAAQGGWQVHHMDVKSAFLNGDLSETVYVKQPPGFVVGTGDNVLKLRKALYGLRQAPRAWNAKLDEVLVALGFVKSKMDHALYRRVSKQSFLIVGVYVDDLIISGPDRGDINMFKAEMMTRFNMSDLGMLSYYLGIEVKQGVDGITISQSSYTKKILETSGMAGCNPCDTPMEQRLNLYKSKEGEAVKVTEYRSIIGSFRYLVNTRPDIAFAVGVVSRYMEAPNKSHWSAVKRILRYLRGTIGYGCKYITGAELRPLLLGFSDSDFAGDVEDRKSTTGVVYFLGGNMVTWASHKQRIVALSSCEAEYVAAAAAACQGVWLSRLIADMLGVKETPVKLLMDNMSAIALSKNPVYHERSKHIDTRYHFLRQCIEEGKVEVDHVGTAEQLADIFTKALGRVKFIELRGAFGVSNVQHD